MMGIEMNEKWDLRMLALARFVSGWSKDPSTRVGAVVARGKKEVALGYNGFPEGVEDRVERLDNRAEKLKMMVHAEMSAMNLAEGDLRGCTLYIWPMASCSVCAGSVIQRGIKRVVAPSLAGHPREAAWADSIRLAMEMFWEVNINVSLYGEEECDRVYREYVQLR